jgi:hypothetical protein
MNDTILTRITPTEFAETLRQSGYRATLVEQQERPQVQSAVQGIGFVVVFGNAAADEPGHYIDLAFQCLIAIQGELPPGLIETWNRDMRFARLFRHGDYLVLAMDFSLTGGVTAEHLCAQCDLWDRVIRDFILRLRVQPVSEVAEEVPA